MHIEGAQGAVHFAKLEEICKEIFSKGLDYRQ